MAARRTAPPGRTTQASRLPRTRQGSPPSLLLTLLGDYWWGQTDPLPSAALVDLLADFGVSDVAARAALSRMVKHGLLESSRQGRHTFYGMTARGQDVMRRGAVRLASFGAADDDWDGRWSLVAFSVPEANRSVREALRTRLRWLGFAPLYDALWLSPHPRHDQALAELADLGVTNATAFVATSPEALPATAVTPQSAWDLDGLAELYRAFVAAWEPTHDALGKGAIAPADALVRRTELMDAWRAFPGLDPDLPRRLLPADWPRDRARELFLDTYDQLGAPAAVRVRQVVAAYAPDLADRVVPFRLTTDRGVVPAQAPGDPEPAVTTA